MIFPAYYGLYIPHVYSTMRPGYHKICLSRYHFFCLNISCIYYSKQLKSEMFMLTINLPVFLKIILIKINNNFTYATGIYSKDYAMHMIIEKQDLFNL